ncbi:MAG: YciI family protein [Gemmataceae bacterium]
MKFAAIIEYIQDKAKIAEVRPAHRQYLTGLLDNGQLAAAGPFTDDWGALIVYEAEDAAAAEKLIKADPFAQHGIFVKYQLRPWNTVFFKPSLFPAKS